MQLKQKAIIMRKELEECQSAIVIAEYNREKVCVIHRRSD